MKKENKRELEQKIIENDRDWNNYLNEVMADGLGLTVEQFKEYEELEEEEEIRAFLKANSTLNWP